MSRQWLNPCPWEPMIFVVFPINSLLKANMEISVPEEYLYAGVFAITGYIFAVWTYSTIN